MDFSRALGTEFREVRELEYDGKAARAVEGSRFYPTGPEDLWNAITDAERLPRWLSPVSGDLQLGGRYQIEGNAAGTITRCDRPRSLEVTWEFAGNVSWVSVRLKPENEGTRLTLVHTMLQDEASEEHWRNYGPGATGVGWDLSFLGLGMFVDSSDGNVDREATELWLSSAAGKTFLRAWAEAWGNAHSAAGEDAEVAQAMAARTAGFYTGE
jgi:uncharacterized protein YndB with AHSA1/START domain